MKRCWIIIFLLLLPGCSLLLPHFLDGIAIKDSALAGYVFINEVSADNVNQDDWVELYNAGTRAVDLSGFYFSDAIDIANWSFPDGTSIAANSYLVVACDGSGKNGNPDFKLQAGIDQAALISPDKKTLIDSLLTIGLSGTGSYGRFKNPDDTITWVLFANPTKGSANQ